MGGCLRCRFQGWVGCGSGSNSLGKGVTIFACLCIFQNGLCWSVQFSTSSQAPSYASPKLLPTHLLTYSLTGVRCRASSVAKNAHGGGTRRDDLMHGGCTEMAVFSALIASFFLNLTKILFNLAKTFFSHAFGYFPSLWVTQLWKGEKTQFLSRTF